MARKKTARATTTAPNDATKKSSAKGGVAGPSSSSCRHCRVGGSSSSSYKQSNVKDDVKKAQAATLKPVKEPARAKAAITGIPSSLLKIWRKEGRCLNCGSETHLRQGCTLHFETQTTTTTDEEEEAASEKEDEDQQRTQKQELKRMKQQQRRQKKRQLKVSKPSIVITPPAMTKKDAGKEPLPVAQEETGRRSRKRGRGGPSGETPRAKRRSPSGRMADSSPKTSGSKRTSKKDFSYAAPMQGVVRMMILTAGGNNVTREAFTEILRKLNETLVIGRMEKGEQVPTVDRWHFTPVMTAADFTDLQSEKAICEFILQLGYQIMTEAEFAESRRSTVVVSGLVRAPTAELSDVKLRELIQAQVEKEGIHGLFEVLEIARTLNKNAILRIKVDEVAMGRFSEMNCSIHIGMAGRVLFSKGRKHLVQRERADSSSKAAPMDEEETNQAESPAESLREGLSTEDEESLMEEEEVADSQAVMLRQEEEEERRQPQLPPKQRQQQQPSPLFHLPRQGEQGHELPLPPRPAEWPPLPATVKRMDQQPPM